MMYDRIDPPGESENLEFKESFSLRGEIGKAISAFSNTNGGVILVGVTDVGGVTGVDIGANTIENEAGYIKRHTDPRIFPFMFSTMFSTAKLKMRRE